MTIEFEPRLFSGDQEIRAIGEGLLACTLPREAWTHEAHLGACLWLLRERPDIVPERDLPAVIRAFNESVGGVNDDTQGYHETLTQLYIAGSRDHHGATAAWPLCDAVNALLAGARGRRDWPLAYYSRPRLFSVAARRGLLLPDLIASDVVADRLAWLARERADSMTGEDHGNA